MTYDEGDDSPTIATRHASRLSDLGNVRLQLDAAFSTLTALNGATRRQLSRVVREYVPDRSETETTLRTNRKRKSSTAGDC